MDVSQFLSALLAIIVIDIVLAGDNAIVIALAARGLPAHLQKKAIVWGAFGAILVRIAMTVIVVWLLKIPGLLLAGGALLVWIAWKLLMPEDSHDDAHGPVATTFWGAMRTVIIADAVMGLDNVLAVAGAAHGSYLLVVLGLLISVPVVVWGSTLVLKVVERFPIVVYLGSGVLLWTAVKMMSSEPLVSPWLAQWPLLKLALWVMIPAVLWAAFLHNHRVLASRIHNRLAELAPQLPPSSSNTSAATAAAGTAATAAATTAAASSGGAATDAGMAAALRAAANPFTVAGEPTMSNMPLLNVLVPVDASPNALLAVRHAVNEYRQNHELRLHLLNVQPRLSRHAARFLSGGDRNTWHQLQADTAMAPARELLDKAQVPYDTHWCIGHRAEEICRAAQSMGAHHIVMGTARKNSITRMVEDSTTAQVLDATSVPVEVISGSSVSKLERWGIPAGLGLGLSGLLWMALD
jgi:YjbE family integral membrane protein